MWIDCKTQLRSLNNCPLLNFDFGPAHSYRSIIINFWLWSPKYGWAHSFDFAEHSWSYLSGKLAARGHSFLSFPSLPPTATAAQIIEICLNFYIKGTGLWRDEIKGGAEGKFWRVSDESGADTGSNPPLFQRTALKKQIQWMKNIF